MRRRQLWGAALLFSGSLINMLFRDAMAWILAFVLTVLAVALIIGPRRSS